MCLTISFCSKKIAEVYVTGILLKAVLRVKYCDNIISLGVW